LEQSQARSVLPEDQENLATKIIQDLIKENYLPFNYSYDGCYARSLYMSAELATSQIPSSAVFVFAKGAHKLTTQSGNAWDFHVAPYIVSEKTKQHLVIDPGLGGAPALAYESWLKFMNSAPAQVSKVVVPGFYYFGYAKMKWNGVVWTNPYASVVCGNAAKCDLEYMHNLNRDINIVISDFKDYPKLKVPFLANACGTMWRFIGEEPNMSLQQIAEKRERLIRRTKQILARLGKLKMLSNFNLVPGENFKKEDLDFKENEIFTCGYQAGPSFPVEFEK
jgi:hypothetical protein